MFKLPKFHFICLPNLLREKVYYHSHELMLEVEEKNPKNWWKLRPSSSPFIQYMSIHWSIQKCYQEHQWHALILNVFIFAYLLNFTLTHLGILSTWQIAMHGFVSWPRCTKISQNEVKIRSSPYHLSSNWCVCDGSCWCFISTIFSVYTTLICLSIHSISFLSIRANCLRNAKRHQIWNTSCEDWAGGATRDIVNRSYLCSQPFGRVFQHDWLPWFVKRSTNQFNRVPMSLNVGSENLGRLKSYGLPCWMNAIYWWTIGTQITIFYFYCVKAHSSLLWLAPTLAIKSLLAECTDRLWEAWRWGQKSRNHFTWPGSGTH